MWEHMRKLQEFIKQIGSKSPSIVAQTNQLQVPSQKADENSHLPIDPAGVRAWLVTHNAFGDGNPDQNLLSTLEHYNRCPISPHDRLKILKQFEAPCARVLQSLDRLFLYLDLPLQEEAESAFKASSDLCKEMAYGYKLVLCNNDERSQALDKKARVFTINKALEHIGRQALRLSMLYRSWPGSIWQDANALVKIAQIDRIENLTTDSQLRVIEQYAHLCSFYLLNTGNFQADELRALFIDLKDQVSAINFQKKPDNNLHEQFCTANDKPPSRVAFTQYSKSESQLYFSLNTVVENLKNNPDRRENPPAYLDHLSVSLQRRSSARSSRDNTINAVTGLTEIHTHMNLMPPTTDTGYHYADPADLIAGNSSPGENIKELLRQPDTSNFGTGFRAENQSANGIGLHLHRAGNCQVQVGELIAHCYGESSEQINWHIGTIQWLKTENDNSLKLGVESIADNARAVKVSRIRDGKKQSSDSFDGVLANGKATSSRATQLLLPAHSFKPGETVCFSDKECTRIFKLAEIVTDNDRYQCFAIYTVKKQSQRPTTTSTVIPFKKQAAVELTTG